MKSIASLRSRPSSTLDRIFLIVFARYRRKLGGGSERFAWRQASNKMGWYLIWPTVSITAVLISVAYSVARLGLGAEYRRLMQIAGVVAVLWVAFALDRHFRRYLLAPPRLSPVESPHEARLLFWFRIISICTFVLTGLLAFGLARAGFKIA